MIFDGNQGLDQVYDTLLNVIHVSVSLKPAFSILALTNYVYQDGGMKLNAFSPVLVNIRQTRSHGTDPIGSLHLNPESVVIRPFKEFMKRMFQLTSDGCHIR
jgi:hypothetical protein